MNIITDYAETCGIINLGAYIFYFYVLTGLFLLLQNHVYAINFLHIILNSQS